MIKELMIKCSVCHREQPESLGACDFCEESRQEWIQSQFNSEGYEVEE